MESDFKRDEIEIAIFGHFRPSGFQLSFIQIDTFYNQLSMKELLKEIKPMVLVKSDF